MLVLLELLPALAMLTTLVMITSATLPYPCHLGRRLLQTTGFPSELVDAPHFAVDALQPLVEEIKAVLSVTWQRRTLHTVQLGHLARLASLLLPQLAQFCFAAHSMLRLREPALCILTQCTALTPLGSLAAVRKDAMPTWPQEGLDRCAREAGRVHLHNLSVVKAQQHH